MVILIIPFGKTSVNSVAVEVMLPLASLFIIVLFVVPSLFVTNTSSLVEVTSPFSSRLVVVFVVDPSSLAMVSSFVDVPSK